MSEMSWICRQYFAVTLWAVAAIHGALTLGAKPFPRKFAACVLHCVNRLCVTVLLCHSCVTVSIGGGLPWKLCWLLSVGKDVMLTGRMAAALPTFSRKFTRGSLNILNRILNHLNHVCTLHCRILKEHILKHFTLCVHHTSRTVLIIRSMRGMSVI